MAKSKRLIYNIICHHVPLCNHINSGKHFDPLKVLNIHELLLIAYLWGKLIGQRPEDEKKKKREEKGKGK